MRPLQQIAKLEQEMAGFLGTTAYVVLLSIPGVSIVTAAEFAGEMGPIANYANDHAITGRAGSIPPATRATRSTAATVRWCAANRKLRAVIMMIADNLLSCNRFFKA